MNTTHHNPNKSPSRRSKLSTAILLASSLALGLSLSGCLIELNVDGETVAKINTTKTGTVAVNNGSITVNGTTYNTSNAKVVTDGVETDASGLKDGMVVSVSGTTSSDGSGIADVITYNDELEGMVTTGFVASSTASTSPSNDSGTILVLGQSVHVDKNTVFESYDVADLSFGDIDEGNIVEVSGYSSGDGEIWATRIEVKDIQHDIGEEIELKGNISNLTDTSFSIGDLTINIEAATLDNDFSGTLKNGQYVEVSSDQGFDNNGILIANKIDLRGSQTDEGSREIKHDNDDDAVEIKGAVTLGLTTNTTTQAMRIEINGVSMLLDTSVTINDATRSRLTQGTIVEVKGYINADGIFVVNKLELDNDENSELNENDDNSNDNSKGSSDDDRQDNNEDNDAENENENENENDD